MKNRDAPRPGWRLNPHALKPCVPELLVSYRRLGKVEHYDDTARARALARNRHYLAGIRQSYLPNLNSK